MSNSSRFQVRFSRKLAMACGAALAAGLFGASQSRVYAITAASPALYAFGVTNNTGSAQGEFQVYAGGDLTTTGTISSYINSFPSPTSSASYSNEVGTSAISFASSSGSTIAAGSSGYFGYQVANGAFTPLGAFPVQGGAWLTSPTATTPTTVDLVVIFDRPYFASTAIQDPYIVVKANVAPTNDLSATTTEYFESAYTTNPNNIVIANNTADSLTLSNYGYFISSTLIPLDQLNSTYLPPGDFTQPLNASGQSGPTVTLAPNSSTTFVDVPTPEPAALLLCAAGCGILLLRRRQRA